MTLARRRSTGHAQRSSSAESTRRILRIAATGAVLDWASKSAAVLALDRDPISIGTAVDLRVSRNPGIAFGMATQLPSGVVLGATILVTAGLIVLAVRGKLPSPTGSGLIIGGAVGNVGDRLLGGTVVDFIALSWWPSFNLADVLLTAGVVVSLVASLRPSGSVDIASTDDSSV